MLDRWLGSILSTGLRAAALIFVWVTTLAVLVNLNNGIAVRGVDSELFLAALALMIPSAFILSSQIFRVRMVRDVQQSQQQMQRSQATRPVANNLSMRDLMALLDDDDLDDLRGEIRESLRARIHRLSDDEPESFEDLLEVAGKRKRGAR